MSLLLETHYPAALWLVVLMWIIFTLVLVLYIFGNNITVQCKFCHSAEKIPSSSAYLLVMIFQVGLVCARLVANVLYCISFALSSLQTSLPAFAEHWKTKLRRISAGLGYELRELGLISEGGPGTGSLHKIAGRVQALRERARQE